MRIKLLLAVAAFAVVGVSCEKDEDTKASYNGSFSMDNETSNVTIASFSKLGATMDVYTYDTLDSEYNTALILLIGDDNRQMTINLSKFGSSSVLGAGTYEYVGYFETDTEKTTSQAVNTLTISEGADVISYVGDGAGSVTINSISETNIDFSFSLSDTTGHSFTGAYSGKLSDTGI